MQGTDYIFPDTSTISTLISDGFNIFRISFRMERLTSEITGSFDEDYLQNLTSVRHRAVLSIRLSCSNMVQVVNAVTEAGAHAVLDPHNYGRLYVSSLP